MAIDHNLLARIQQLEDESPNPDLGEASALETTAMAIAYIVAVAREAGVNEVDAVETALFDVRMERERLRSDATLLAKLGYRDVAFMLQRLARRSKANVPKSETGGARGLTDWYY